MFIVHLCTARKQYGSIILKRIKNVNKVKVEIYNKIHLIAFITHLLLVALVINLLQNYFSLPPLLLLSANSSLKSISSLS